MQDPRFESLLQQLESFFADFRAQRRERQDDDPRLLHMARQVEQLQVENQRLRERQDVVCGRLERLLNDLEPVEE